MQARAMALFSLVAFALATAAPARADTPDLAQSLIMARDAAGRDDCSGVLGSLDPVLPGLAEGDERVLVQRMRLVCLGREGRMADLAAAQGELAKALPRDGTVRAFGVIIAASENRFVEAADQLTLIAETSPKSLDILTGAAVREIASRLDHDKAKAPRERMMVALARAGWEPVDSPELRVGFAENAIGALIGQGESDEAEGLLERIDSPELLTAMAVDRHYAPLWKAIETKLGPAGATSVDRFARDKVSLYGDAPGSEPALRDAASAMLLLGRFQDVIDMTDDVVVADGMSRDAVEITLQRARAFAILKRNDQAAELLSRFQKVDLRHAPEASTGLITYAEFLDEVGRPAQALEAARAARTQANGILNDFAMRWIDRTEVCSLGALGRTAEANAAMDKLKALVAQNNAATIEALLCLHRDKEASAIALKAFADDETASELLYQFQPQGSLWAAAPSRLRVLWTTFLARPEIKAAFERHGRILPRSLWPAEQPRSIPRRRGDGADLT